jgi:hypothetical protein
MKKMKTLCTLFLLLALSLSVQAQIDNSGVEPVQKSFEIKKNILGVKVGITDPVFAVVYERLFTPFLGMEVEVGFLGASIGPKIFLPSLRPQKVNFHTGVIIGSGYFAGGGYGYLPIGINRVTKDNFVISLDLGPQYLFDGEEFLPGATFKIGKAF